MAANLEGVRMVDMRTVPDPFLGEINVPAGPLRFSEQPEGLDLMTPTLGRQRLSAAGVLRVGGR